MLVAVAGVGLIGASIGAGLRAAGHEVVGWDPAPASTAVAVDRGAIDRSAGSFETLTGLSPDLLVVAAPPRASTQLVARLPEDLLAMDVTGVKLPVVRAAAGSRLVATHPMAGRERTGPEAASPVLFRGAAWIVVTDTGTPEDRELVTGLIRELGANPVEMSAARHDRAVAVVSHLPQLLAAALVSIATEDPDTAALAAGSFRDLTRVASSDPSAWSELLVENNVAVGAAIDRLVAVLGELREAADRDDRERLEARLRQAKQARDAMAPAVVPVRVALADRPGELAKVGRAFARTGVDVRDLQLRHATFGGGGVLTISVRPGEAAPLMEALAAEGLEVGEPG